MKLMLDLTFVVFVYYIATSASSSVYKRFAVFISNTFISNTRLKLAKNQANAKQNPEAELLLFENYSHSSSTLSSKNNRTYSKKNKQITNLSVFMRLWD